MRSSVREVDKEPHYLHRHAEDNLRFIRDSMERAATFTGVSGQGYVATGLTAFAASGLAAQQDSVALWVGVWIAELALATAIMLGFTVAKTRAQGLNLFQSAIGAKLLQAFLPGMMAGAILSLGFYRQGLHALLPALWLSLYGAAVITAGAHSVRVLPLMGISFMLMGAIAILSPINADLLMALGFGGLHVAFGVYIWRRHGG